MRMLLSVDGKQREVHNIRQRSLPKDGREFWRHLSHIMRVMIMEHMMSDDFEHALRSSRERLLGSRGC
jgi:hypothetical protein